MNELTAYRSNAWDWLIAKLGDAVLYLATPKFRALAFEALQRGLKELAREADTPNPVFTEPMDDGLTDASRVDDLVVTVRSVVAELDAAANIAEGEK